MVSLESLKLITAQAAPGGENALMGMLPIILMFVILYFLMIRPQMKRQKEHRNMVSALAKGDEVITQGGMLGKLTGAFKKFSFGKKKDGDLDLDDLTDEELDALSDEELDELYFDDEDADGEELTEELPAVSTLQNSLE